MKPHIAAVVFLALHALPSPADEWPGWRGPFGTGVSNEKNPPIEWSANNKVRWKIPLRGAGVSTPVVWGERVFITASDGRQDNRLHVYCFHRDNGRLLWHSQFFGSSIPVWYFPAGGMAVPTPATDGERLYTLFGSGDLICLDFEGRPVWIRSLANEYGPFRNRWGMAASPLLIGDMLVVLVDHWGPSYLLAVDTRTGQNLWRTARDTSANWSSPVAAGVAGKTQIITSASFKIQGYDAKTGKELWSVGGVQMQCIPTPVVHEGKVFAVSGRKGQNVAIRLSERVTEKDVIWKETRGAPNIPSALCYGKYYYTIEDAGFATCFEADTGKQVWRERMGGRYQASLIAADGKIYFTNLAGEIKVIRAGPKFELLARNDLGEEIVATPALAHGRLFIRTRGHLFCIGR
ncbi:MAG: serine/threonine protein kinase [Gemmatales bacterium]|nr:MAG: serine/threonine protein kinase [Gemmatales bacterium]